VAEGGAPTVGWVADEFSERYGDLLAGSYDCVDRLVLNAYFPLGYSPGGFRTWWRRLHGGSDGDLDGTHLMRMAGRFARRVRASAQAHGIPVVDCTRGERKHRIAEDYLATHPVSTGVFLILVARAVAPVWDVHRSDKGAIRDLQKKKAFINHYSFHLMDPEWGHVTIKMSGHPPFGAQVILNGHDYVACQARAAGTTFRKEGNCFTGITDPAGLARVADTLSLPAAVGRLSQVCDRWIYTACLCFGLDLAEQQRSDFTYSYSVYQAEYSRNLLFRSGAQMDRVFDRLVDRTRTQLDVPTVRTLFGAKARPHRDRAGGGNTVAAVLETPRYGLTVFKVHFGLLTLKAYTKGEHVLRFEAIVHNTKDLGTGRVLDKFPDIVVRLADMADRFCTVLDCVDLGFLPDGTLDRLPLPSQIGRTRVGGIDLNKARMRAVLAAVLALSAAPAGFTVADVTAKVNSMSRLARGGYTARQAAYDLRKLRGKDLITKLPESRRYQTHPQAARTIAALLTLREHVIAPLLAGVRSPRQGRKPATWTPADRHYDTLRTHMRPLFDHLGISTDATAA
jgi:hypothetical protein